MSETENVEKKRILWVDDYPENNWIEIADFTHTRKISVTKAPNTAVALRQIDESGQYDLIISDIGRKECTSEPEPSAQEAEKKEGVEPEDRRDAGFEFLRKLRETGDNTPVVFYTSPFQVTRFKDREGKRGVVTVTASPEELYESVRKVLELDEIHVVPARRTRLKKLKEGIGSSQDRGREFERYLNQIFSEEGLDPRGSFRPKGEEVDGSITFNGRTFVVEAKWTQDPLPASAIYMFKGKVDGKMTGTIGVVVSWSGYSDGAADALKVGKDLNIVLITGEEIEAVADGIRFKDLLAAKLRLLAEKGDVQGDVLPLLKGKSKGLTYDVLPQLFVVCETHQDRYLLRALAKRVLKENAPYGKGEKTQKSMGHIVRFVAAGGKMAIPDTVRGLMDYSPRHLVVVADTDGNEEMTRDYIRSQVGKSVKKIILVHSQVEMWALKDKEKEGLKIMPSIELRRLYRENEKNEGMPSKSWIETRVMKHLKSLPDDEAFKRFSKEVKSAMQREHEYWDQN